MSKLALKYRPTELEEVLGQEHIALQLKGALASGKLDSTFLITGPYGTGKTTFARLIATYVNCKDRVGDNPPCGKCSVCTDMRKNPPKCDYYVEVNAADSRGIDSVRSLIAQSQYKAPGKRVFVLDEAHQLTGVAVQALLKPLEEPSPSAIWILCTTERDQIPGAIASRCTKLNVQAISTENVVSLLTEVSKREDIEVPETVLERIAVAAQGHPRDALSVLEEAHNIFRSGGDFTEDMIEDIVTDLIQETPDQAAGKLLLAAYTGKYTAAIRAVSSIASPAFMADKLLALHEQTIRFVASPKLRDPYRKDWYDLLEQREISASHIEMLVEQSRELILCAERLKTYNVGAQAVLFDCAVAMVNIAKKHTK